MKIIRLSTFLDFGGVETKMANLSYLHDENDWIFVAIGKGGDAEKRIKENGKVVKCLYLQHKIPSFKTIYKLYKFLKNEKPDVLHTSGAEANFFGFFAGKLAKTPKIIVEEIGIPSHSKIANKIFGFIFKNADLVVGESTRVVENSIQSFKLRLDHTKVVSNFGIFNYDFSKIKIDRNDKAFQIIMISRLEPVKNIEGVLNVLSVLIKNNFDVKLTIAGTGSSELILKEKVKVLNLEKNVEFLGFMSDPYPYLLNSDLYVLNSFSEGFSNSLVEAMYSKTPSLSTAVGAAPEIIEDGKNGFLVAVNDEDALFERIQGIMNMEKEERVKIGERGHKTIIDNFSLEKHIEKLMEIYD